MNRTGGVAVEVQHPVKDYNHSTDQEYQRLRKLADEAYKKRDQLSHQSQTAYQQGDKKSAHELSEKSKAQLKIAEDLNMQAAEYVFVENNADSSSNEIDLHGLYVKEALFILQRRIKFAVDHNEAQLNVIVGKGLHSQNGIAKLKPSIEKFCAENGIKNHLEKGNSGVLVLELRDVQMPVNGAGTSAPANQYNAQPQPQYNNNGGQLQGQTNNNNDTDSPLAKIFKIFCSCIQSLT
ncbi:YPL199C [Saccharomyces arboricola H-6]|uniref:YPL199C n=1 Tax=Saccharomyces arboricola (strain H-6 / AS 2.3317 / CBS 10644) TaxID=1160507 RepID=J8PYF4_SACAR|nr:YPL199C [Saccharomyces arboricola H-6]